MAQPQAEVPRAMLKTTPPEDQTGVFPPYRPSLEDRLRIQTWALTIIAFGVAVFLLWVGSSILISLAFGIILFSVTTATIDQIARLRLGRFYFPRWIAVVLAVTLLSFCLILLAVVVVNEVNRLITTMLLYSDAAINAVARLFAWLGPEATSAVQNAIQTINFNAYLRSIAFQLSGLVSIAVMTSLVVGFLFAEQHWFHAKLLNLFSSPERAAGAAAISRSIIRRVNRYLLVKSAVSLVTGLEVYLVMRLAGLEFAGAMGMLTVILNFIPTIGSLAASVLTILAVFIQMPEPWVTVTVSLIVCGIQFGNGNIIEPIFMGRTLQLSTFCIVLALAFWGAIWGIAGLFLAVPMMVAAMILCSHIPPLRPLAVLMSRDGQPDSMFGAGDPAPLTPQTVRR
ncbi:hypothetical protein CG51_04855 [Haematobacter missouriensis]|uniref:AI-2E family transporter n=2 Tax=Haematobacter missouriensis TaxID=366616 RepID=A0A212AXF6_9RHOB|nr:hypothetical protein CG51_04855 [Haematobacter missouriensis]OWJ72324.1 AI-2E family transporter [Haematobacter missouriensis]OWJ86173.1 AI-2E family transporter [Haematobacter missouriensis]